MTKILNHLHSVSHSYFLPEKLWEKNKLGKFQAVGLVVSYLTIFVPFVMGILKLSTIKLDKRRVTLLKGNQEITSLNIGNYQSIFTKNEIPCPSQQNLVNSTKQLDLIPGCIREGINTFNSTLSNNLSTLDQKILVLTDEYCTDIPMIVKSRAVLNTHILPYDLTVHFDKFDQAVKNAKCSNRDPLKNTQKVKFKTIPDEVLWDTLQEETSKLPYNSFYKNEIEHRYDNVECPRKTAIKIDGKYIHANRIGETFTQRHFVASQAPVKSNIHLFWSGIFSSGYTIIDLTSESDQDLIDCYHPNAEINVIDCADLIVTFKGVDKDVCSYEVISKITSETKFIKRLHHSTWIDGNDTPLEFLVKLVAQIENDFRDSPLWIHCKAGVGRTGTLIAAYLLKEKIDNGTINIGNFEFSLLKLLLTLRTERGKKLFVQSIYQFDLLMRYGRFLLNQNN